MCANGSKRFNRPSVRLKRRNKWVLHFYIRLRLASWSPSSSLSGSMSSACVIQSRYPFRSSSSCCFSRSFWKSPRALAFSRSLENSLWCTHADKFTQATTYCTEEIVYPDIDHGNVVLVMALWRVHLGNYINWTLTAFVTLEHKSSLESLGYICSNSQKYIVWVKIIDFSFMPKIISILSKDHVSWRYLVNFLP